MTLKEMKRLLGARFLLPRLSEAERTVQTPGYWEARERATDTPRHRRALREFFGGQP
jgi:hypothetical protein